MDGFRCGYPETGSDGFENFQSILLGNDMPGIPHAIVPKITIAFIGKTVLPVYPGTKDVRVYLEGRWDVPIRTFSESMGARLGETPEESEKWTFNLVL